MTATNLVKKNLSNDIKFMRQALRLARKGLGRSSPNPAVGAIVVRDGVLVGQGVHVLAGTPHAEIYALTQAREMARGASIYITLEPCHHHGRTPPCTSAILEAGISRVFYGVSDPNPKAMNGSNFLSSRGVIVVPDLLKDACMEEHRFFLTYLAKKRPHVIFKIAATLDGKTATVTGDSRWLTGESARREVHRWRNWCDAICIGSGTVFSDNPHLTCRIKGGRDPLRLILDTTLKISPVANVLNKGSQARCVVACEFHASLQRRIILEKAGAEILTLPKAMGKLDLNILLAELGRRGITSLLLEGGAELAWSFMAAGLLDEIMFFFTPKLLGGAVAKPIIGGVGFSRIIEALNLGSIQTKKFGKDLLLRARTLNNS